VVCLSCRKSQTGADIVALEIGKSASIFGLANSGCEKIEDVLDPDTHATDARATAALVRIKGDAIHRREPSLCAVDSKGTEGLIDNPRNARNTPPRVNQISIEAVQSILDLAALDTSPIRP